MEALHATLNSQVPNRNMAEYRQQYYHDNRNEINQKCKQYYQGHKNEIKQYKQQCYEDNKAELSKKHDCPCGGRYTLEHKPKHLKTECHRNYELGKHMYEAKFGHA